MTIRTVTSNAEYAVEYAAAISGDTIEFSGSGFTGQFLLSGKSGLIYASADSSSNIPALKLAGTISNFVADSLNIQMTGWPYDFPACVYIANGTYTNMVFDGCLFRHGYGASLVDMARLTDYPEYDRVDNVLTATTASGGTANALTWENAAATDGWIEFFNRGVVDVYCTVGGSGVTTSTGTGTLCAAGVRTRISNLDPSSDTHIAVVTASSSSEINARAEIGLRYYQARAFSAEGSANHDILTIQNCKLYDVFSGIKSVGNISSKFYGDSNDFLRIYSDIIALGMDPGSEYQFTRNLFDVTLARSGISEAQNGDAHDPHGDQIQGFASGTGTIGKVLSAGNRTRYESARADSTGQGLFVNQNFYTPGYSYIHSINDTFLGSAANGTQLSEPPYGGRASLIYGATIIDSANLTTGAPKIRHSMSQTTVAKSISANGILDDTGGTSYPVSHLSLQTAASPAAVFPNVGDLTTALTRVAVDAALTGAVEGLGLGSAATADAIDWVTTDLDAIVLWDNVASGVGFADATNIAPGVVHEFAKSEVLNEKATQSVVPGSGVEWRSFDTDGTTVIQSWTTSSGTIGTGEFLQIRKAALTTSLATVTATITVNGQDVSPTIQTALVLVDAFEMNGAGFRGTTNVPASTSVMEFEWKGQLNSTPGAPAYIFGQNLCAEFYFDATSSLRGGSVRDSSSTVIGTFAVNQSITQGVPVKLRAIVDFPGLSASVYLNDVLLETITLSANTGSALSGRKINFGTTGSSGVTSPVPADTYTEYFQCWLTTSAARSLYKEISVSAQGSIAGVNADPWKVSGTVLAAPDIAAPVLSGLTLSASGSSSIEFYFSTTDGNGTAYWFASTSATPPSATDLIAGTGSVAYGSVAVSASGLQTTIPVSGLTPETVYYVYVMHDDAATNRSDIVSDSVETPSGTPTWQDIADSAPNTLTITNVQAGDYGRQFRRKIVGLTTQYSRVVEIKEPI